MVRKNNAAFILIVVLILLSAMSLLSAMLSQNATLERSMSANFVNKVRSRLMARSGVEAALAHRGPLDLNFSYRDRRAHPVGDGTFVRDGDSYRYDFKDASPCININDGIRAGAAELGALYDSREIDPWPTDDIDAPNVSGLINLRCRRLLNALGDVHKFRATVGVPTAGNFGMAFAPTATAAGDRGRSQPLGLPSQRGLGDVILVARPEGGFESLEDIRLITDAWGQRHLPGAYLSSEGGSFFERLVGDLTTDSYEDKQFARLKEEPGPFHNVVDSSSGDGATDPTDCRFQPRYLDADPIDLTASSLWARHCVPLIDIHHASLEVKAAVFYANCNVSFLCEGAVTHAHHVADIAYPTVTTDDPQLWKHLGMARTSVGVRGVCFSRITENNATTGAQKNRFMSLRDAQRLAAFADSASDPVTNFDDFAKLLKEYRLQAGSGGDVAYERAERMDGSSTYFTNHVRALFVSPHDDRPVWVSQYYYSGGRWQGGYFLDDYVERALPQVLSCLRRIPGCLGAPLALTSPYMVVEPFAYTTDLSTSGVALGGRDSVGVGAFAAAGGQATADAHLGRQPKISFEDFVQKQASPKVSFMSNGVYHLSSRGQVKAHNGKVAAATVIEVVHRVFDTARVHSQAAFAKLNPTGDTTDMILGPNFHGQPSRHWLSLGLRDCNSRAGSQATPGHASANVQRWDLYLDGVDSTGLPTAFQSQEVNTGFPDNDIDTAPTSPGIVNRAGAGLEEASAVSWETADGHDSDPFGGGLFFSQNGHGEWVTNEADRFRDSLYWRLNNKMKDWSALNTYFDCTVKSPALGLHRGFAAAWFRVPTAYPFAQPVFYGDLLILDKGRALRNKTHLFRTIFSLNFDNVMITGLQPGGAAHSVAENPTTIMVGYYSGMDSTSVPTFEFEHGIVGHYHFGRVYGVTSVHPTTQIPSPVPAYANIEPSYTIAPMTFSVNLLFSGRWVSHPLNYTYNGDHWFYACMLPWHFSYVTEPDMGLPTVYSDAILTYPNGMSVEHDVEVVHGHYGRSNTIEHRLPMNTSPECGPGSWHRLYAFWFMRLVLGDTATHRRPPLGGLEPCGDDTSTTGDPESRYGVSAVGSAGGYDVDGLDQFGIWFRDDSNFTTHCGNGVSRTPKPQFTYIEEGPTANNPSIMGWRSQDPNMSFALGETHLQRNKIYRPASGEATTHGNPQGTTFHYAGFRMDSSIDDFIFAYGPEISIPGSSWFPWLFHNAEWLVDENGVITSGDVRSGHSDEIRYDVDSQPRFQFELCNNGDFSLIEPQSTLLHVGSRVFHPRDENMNYSDVRVDLRQSGALSIDATSDNGQDFILASGQQVQTDLNIRFQYRNTRPNPDLSPSVMPVTESLAIYNYQNSYGTEYDNDGGDSFTNIPYIQEVTVRFRRSSGNKILKWFER